jgi:endoglucanase
MLSARFRMKGIAIFATATLALAMTATPTLAAGGGFYVPPPDKGAVNQIKDLVKKGSASDLRNAALLTAMVSEGHAVWFTGGTPSAVREQVKKTMSLASAQGTVPVLVAYNLPYRDCGQYSAGGARSAADYAAWIDGFASGIGNGTAVVILEPDSLGLIPGTSNCTVVGPENTPADRYGELNGAVNRLEQQPNVSVYLDATHSGWLNVGDAATRLVAAGVKNAEGFFLNVSNYQYTSNEVMYGTWISQCIAYGNYSGCPNQYWVGGPANNWGVDWTGGFSGALSPYGVWSDSNPDQALNTAGINWRYASPDASPRMPAGTTHFVIDTSRNGQGPWNFAADSEGLFRTYEGFAADGDALADGYTSAAAAQDWCNPPGRGLGIPPTTITASTLVDAYLWIKVPGESDGSCARPAGGTTDAEWGNIVDPAAGQWFPQQALELAQLANPPLF